MVGRGDTFFMSKPFKSSIVALLAVSLLQQPSALPSRGQGKRCRRCSVGGGTYAWRITFPEKTAFGYSLLKFSGTCVLSALLGTGTYVLTIIQCRTYSSQENVSDVVRCWKYTLNIDYTSNIYILVYFFSRVSQDKCTTPIEQLVLPLVFH